MLHDGIGISRWNFWVFMIFLSVQIGMGLQFINRCNQKSMKLNKQKLCCRNDKFPLDGTLLTSNPQCQGRWLWRYLSWTVLENGATKFYFSWSLCIIRKNVNMFGSKDALKCLYKHTHRLSLFSTSYPESFIISLTCQILAFAFSQVLIRTVCGCVPRHWHQT